MKRLIRVVKYLFITRALELYFPTPEAHGQGASHIEVFTDSDWAGEQHRRKSSSSAVSMVGGCTLACISRGQNIRAQSSTEAEIYAAVMGTAEATHLQQLLGWAGIPLRMRLHIDSSAGRSALLWRCVGRIRHLEVKVLWIQDMTNCGRLLVDKVKGTENVADSAS